MKQRIGDISGSKDVSVAQVSGVRQEVRGDEQEVGSITDSERVRLTQVVSGDENLATALRMAITLAGEARELPEGEAAEVAQLVVELLNEDLPEPVSIEDIKTSLEVVESRGDVPASLRSAFHDLAATISTVSGSIALWQLADPVAVAIGLPALMGVAGLLAGDKIRAIYGKVVEKICIIRSKRGIDS